jgi:Fur family transcriptional regulator, ferric uptake regulator
MKTSLYKEKILKIFQDTHVLSIADVHKKLKGADFSTIYRNIESLLKEGKLKKIIVNEDITVYERADAKHHDHFICTECGEVEEVHIAANILGKGSKAKAKDVVIRGVCGPCNR